MNEIKKHDNAYHKRWRAENKESCKLSQRSYWRKRIIKELETEGYTISMIATT